MRRAHIERLVEIQWEKGLKGEFEGCGCTGCPLMVQVPKVGACWHSTFNQPDRKKKKDSTKRENCSQCANVFNLFTVEVCKTFPSKYFQCIKLFVAVTNSSNIAFGCVCSVVLCWERVQLRQYCQPGLNSCFSPFKVTMMWSSEGEHSTHYPNLSYIIMVVHYGRLIHNFIKHYPWTNKNISDLKFKVMDIHDYHYVKDSVLPNTVQTLYTFSV